jgi:rubredoxin
MADVGRGPVEQRYGEADQQGDHWPLEDVPYQHAGLADAEPPADPFGDGEKPKDGKLIDKDGREYRVCPQCAYNMYKQGRMWVCENCGYSYVE